MTKIPAFGVAVQRSRTAAVVPADSREDGGAGNDSGSPEVGALDERITVGLLIDDFFLGN